MLSCCTDAKHLMLQSDLFKCHGARFSILRGAAQPNGWHSCFAPVAPGSILGAPVPRFIKHCLVSGQRHSNKPIQYEAGVCKSNGSIRQASATKKFNMLKKKGIKLFIYCLEVLLTCSRTEALVRCEPPSKTVKNQMVQMTDGQFYKPAHPQCHVSELLSVEAAFFDRKQMKS